MSVPGPSTRYLYVFDPTAATGYNLTATNGQVGEFNPPTIENVLQELTGSASVAPVFLPVGHQVSEDFEIPLWADSSLQGLIDDWHGTTASDRSNARIVVHGWKATAAKGSYCEFGEAYLFKVLATTPPAALTELKTTWKYNGAARVGITLHALGAETADGGAPAGAGIDNGAATTAGGVGAWGYTALNLDGGTAFAPRIVDSADDVTYGALITFTSVTATTGGGQITALSNTATVKRYVDCDWDFTGTPGGAATCTFWIAFARKL